MARTWILLSLLLLSFWAHARPTVILATDSFPPYYGPHLKQQGILSEITRSAFERAGYQLIIAFLPWKRALEHARKGLYDGVMAGYFTKERTADFIYSRSIGESQLVFFKLSERQIDYKNLDDLKGYRVGVINGYHYTTDFDQANYIRKVKANNLFKNMQRLVAGRLDLVASDEAVGFDLMKNHFSKQEQRQVSVLSPPLETNKMYILFSRKSPRSLLLEQRFNKALEGMREDGTLKRIIAEYKIKLSGILESPPTLSRSLINSRLSLPVH
ncbi:substrate-binding periplasmic protein [Dongshaea marina]|uniref:substrate-binding periplasmic protein n=1 Tax=Dongshaea marina TaxID=2047966 RepID=UPI00131EFF5E|nr:transporter substrate-binding domain-containing protein [Dongshaea marina]